MMTIRALEERPVDLGCRALGMGHSHRVHVSLRWTPGSPLCCGQAAPRDSSEQGEARGTQPVIFPFPFFFFLWLLLEDKQVG